MNVRYRKLRDDTRPDGYFLYPLLRVFVRHGVNMIGYLALLDTGATDCIFPASSGARDLGIDIRKGRPIPFKGIAAQEADGFVHRVQLQVEGFKHWIDIDAAFVEKEEVPILGQSGFFDNYQVVFERFRREFEVNTKADALIRRRKGGYR